MNLRPAVWRQILIRGSVKLSKLNAILLTTMGWDGGHMHQFVIGGTDYAVVDPVFRLGVWDNPPMLDENKMTLAAALGDRKSFTHLYDFGDSGNIASKSKKSCRRIPTYARRSAWPAATPVRPMPSVAVPGTSHSWTP